MGKINNNVSLARLAAFILPNERARRYTVKWSLMYRRRRCCISGPRPPWTLFIMSAISGRRLHRDRRHRPSSFLSELHLYKSLKTHRPWTAFVIEPRGSVEFVLYAPTPSKSAGNIVLADRQISVCRRDKIAAYVGLLTYRRWKKIFYYEKMTFFI